MHVFYLCHIYVTFLEFYFPKARRNYVVCNLILEVDDDYTNISVCFIVK